MNPTTGQPIDLTALLSDGRHFAQRSGDRIHIIDSLTGNSIVVYAQTPAGVPTHFVEHTENGVTSWIQEGLQPSAVPAQKTPAFSPAIIHLMCNEIAHGKSITKLCGTAPYPPYPILRKWARIHPWIDEEFDRARRDRAEYFRDKVIDEAENSESSKDPILASQLKTDVYKWAASVDHEKYNPRAKIEATVNTPTQIIISTGIVRDAVPVASVPPAVEPPEALPPAVPADPPGVIPEAMRKYDE